MAEEPIKRDSFTFRNLFGPAHQNSFLGALALLACAYVFEHYANLYELAYSVRPTSVSVGDLLLDNLPVVNLNLIIIEGALLAIVLTSVYVLLRPRYLLFTLKALALFIVVRALFISLTHVGIYPGHIGPDGLGVFDGIYTYLNFQTGFFFSGHTGLPILMALIFWGKRNTRSIFLFLSFIFGTAVLLAHIHYSIDVFAAPFMAYGIFELAKRFFPDDYKLIEAAP